MVSSIVYTNNYLKYLSFVCTQQEGFEYYFNSSNWGQKSKTRVSYWWRCISLFAHEFSVKNKYTFSNYTFSNVKTLFALLVTHKEKRPSRMPVNLKKSEFAPVGVRDASSSHIFHPEATGEGGKVQSKKLYYAV